MGGTKPPHQAGLGDADGLLLHRLMDGGALGLRHGVELVNAAADMRAHSTDLKRLAGWKLAQAAAKRQEHLEAAGRQASQGLRF